jgi:hypothetical protein
MTTSASVAIPTVRVVAYNHSSTMPEVNISTAAHPQLQWKPYQQAPKQAPAHEYPTFQAGLTGAGPFKNGLRTIFISGYTGPA